LTKQQRFLGQKTSFSAAENNIFSARKQIFLSKKTVFSAGENDYWFKWQYLPSTTHLPPPRKTA
jgi:hypothetical protein